MQDVPVPLAGQPASTSDAGASIPAANGDTHGSAHKGAHVESEPRGQDPRQSREPLDRENRENRQPRELRPRAPGPVILTFALNQRPRATRASAPKVRTGCKMCKKRRIKCDEGKPACNRCIKANYVCEGYDPVDEDDDPPTQAIAPAPALESAAFAPESEPAESAELYTRAGPSHASSAPPTAAMFTSIVTPSILDPNILTDPTIAALNHSYSSNFVSSAPAEANYGTYGRYTLDTPGDAMPSETTDWASGSMASTPPAARYVPSSIEPQTVAEPQALISTRYNVKTEFPGDSNFRFLDAVPVQTQPSIYDNSLSQFGGIRVGNLQKRERDDDDNSETTGYVSTPDYSHLYQSHQALAYMPQAQASDFLLEPNYNSAMFSSQDEKMYFDSWLTLAPNLGGGWFPSHLWTTTIPHLCEIDNAIKYAAIAVGAMAEAMSPALLGKSSYHLIDYSGGEGRSVRAASVTLPGSDGTVGAYTTKDPNVATNVVRHYRKALTYFGIALRLTRLASNGSSASSPSASSVGTYGEVVGENNSEVERAAVMCCLLFVCFEALQGNRENALRHITHGLNIIDQFVVRNVPRRALAPQDRPKQFVKFPSAAALERGASTDSAATSSNSTISPLDPESERQRQRQRVRDRQLGYASTDASAKDSIQTDSNATNPLRNEQRPIDGLTRVLTRSPAPYILEDEVMQVFRRLDFQAWSLGVFRLRRTRPADIKLQALDALNPATIPDRFDSLDDARRWWDLVQHWVLQFPRYMVTALQRYMDENPDAEERAKAAGRMLDICDVPGADKIQKEYLQCLERWEKAFQPVYNAARDRANISKQGGARSPSTTDTAETGRRDEAYLQAASLHVPYILAWIGVKSLVYSDYESMHSLTPQFLELNRLAAIILPRQPRYSWSPFGGGASISNVGGAGLHSFGGDLFTMDNGPTMALFIVSCKCRIEAVRDEAIRLLAAYPRRDGFWDSKVLWAIGNWNRVIEAENLEGTPYEQWLRLRQREAIFDETKPQVHMTAWVKNKATGEFEFKRQIVTWDSR